MTYPKVGQWQSTDILTIPGSGTWVNISQNGVTCGVCFSTYDEYGVKQSGSGKVQITLSSDDDIKNNIAVPVDWTGGICSGVTKAMINGATAARLICTSGIVRMDIGVKDSI